MISSGTGYARGIDVISEGAHPQAEFDCVHRTVLADHSLQRIQLLSILEFETLYLENGTHFLACEFVTISAFLGFLQDTLCLSDLLANPQAVGKFITVSGDALSVPDVWAETRSMS